MRWARSTRPRRGERVLAAVVAGALVVVVAPAGAATESLTAGRVGQSSVRDAGGERLPGAPVAPVEVELSQPDGSTFEAVPWGDRSQHGYETPEGHTVVRATSGEWRYADGREADGELAPGPAA